MEEMQKSRLLIAVCSLLSAAAGAGGAIVMIHPATATWDMFESIGPATIVGFAIGFSLSSFKTERPAWEGSVAIAALMTVSVIVSAAFGMIYTGWRSVVP